MIMQQSMMSGKYHRTLVAYIVTLTQKQGKTQEWETMCMMLKSKSGKVRQTDCRAEI